MALRVVVDTNILISAFGWPGNERALIEKAIEGKIQLCISSDIFEEFEEVSSRPKFKFSKEDIDDFIGALIEVADIVIPSCSVNIVKRDPSDNKFLECALEAKADYIVTGDNHLLKLKEYKGVKIVRTRGMLEKL